MNRTTRAVAVRMLVAGLCGLAGLALVRTAVAQNTSETTKRSAGNVSRERERRLMGTIESMDKETREVTLADEQGQKERFRVPSAFKGFDKLKVGDRVNVTYTESVALSLGKPGEKAGVETREGATQTPAAEGRAGARMHEIKATAEVMAVDPQKHEVTFKGPEGNIRTVAVEDPELRTKLSTVKPGDTLQLVYTEAMVGSITPAKKK
jgi:hypothetical protein